jgi:hypothetical protein
MIIMGVEVGAVEAELGLAVAQLCEQLLLESNKLAEALANLHQDRHSRSSANPSQLLSTEYQ